MSLLGHSDANVKMNMHNNHGNDQLAILYDSDSPVKQIWDELRSVE